MKVSNDNGKVRIEHSEDGVITVLEGMELVKLNEAFSAFMKQSDEIEDPVEAVMISAMKAYARVHHCVLSNEEVENKSTADGRKLNLYCRAMVTLLKKLAENPKLIAKYKKPWN